MILHEWYHYVPEILRLELVLLPKINRDANQDSAILQNVHTIKIHFLIPNMLVNSNGGQTIENDLK